MTCDSNEKTISTPMIIIGVNNTVAGFGMLIPGALLLAKAHKENAKGTSGWVAMVVIGTLMVIGGIATLGSLPLTKTCP